MTILTNKTPSLQDTANTSSANGTEKARNQTDKDFHSPSITQSPESAYASAYASAQDSSSATSAPESATTPAIIPPNLSPQARAILEDLLAEAKQTCCDGSQINNSDTSEVK